MRLIILLLFSFSAAFADSYHNINTLVGEKAAGIGGAYTAISDDPSGMFYNPAGIAFAPDNFVSISANTYGESEKRYQNVFGKGSDYVRKSGGFNPNFIGTIKQIGDWKTGFAVLSPSVERYDQSDQFFLPQTRPNLARFKIDYTEDNQTYLFGMSAGKSFSKKLSIGATLFGFNDNSRIITNQLVEGKSGNFSNVNIQDRRKTLGIIPLIGLQYLITDKLAFGLSTRKHIVTNGRRSITGLTTGAQTNSYGQAINFHNTHSRSAQVGGGSILIGPPVSGNVPEVTETRAGLAFFASQSMLFSFDTIYTSGYKKTLSRNNVELNSGYLILRDGEDPTLRRESTLNFAAGMEFFPIETLSLRFGLYTNKANTKPIDWARSAIDLYLAENGKNIIPLGNGMDYRPEALQPKSRIEHVNVTGYTFGFGWETAKSSISVTYVYEYGRGNSQIDSSQLPQSMLYKNESVYLVASSHN